MIIGVPSIITGLIFAGRKLQVLDTIEDDLKDNIRPDLKDIRERFASFEGKYAGLTKIASPVSLTEKGEALLNASGLKQYIDDNFDKAPFTECSDNSKVKNAYDVQTHAFSLLDSHEFPAEIDKKLKESAYNEGIGMELVRRVGAIYLRNKCLEKLHMDAKDLDKPNE